MGLLLVRLLLLRLLLLELLRLGLLLLLVQWLQLVLQMRRQRRLLVHAVPASRHCHTL